MKHQYHYRPAYGSEDMLIELVHTVDFGKFIVDLLEALKSINPQLTGLDDLWMNDEIIYTITSDHGSFLLSKDIWDCVFLMADHNQGCMAEINNLLFMDHRFEKVDIDHGHFKLKSK